MSPRLLFAAAVLGLAGPATAAEPKSAKDVVYGRRDGLALTMDVTVPKNPNKVGIIVCVSGDFKSTEQIRTVVQFAVVPKLTARGYTVFAVMHSSQPRYTVPEIVDDVHRAVRFIKSRADEYGVDPEKLGIAGASSGGHLALMMGCGYKEANPNATDELEKYSSKVAAVACFFPVTDFVQFDREELPDNQKPFRTLFDIRKFDTKTNKLERITDAERREAGRLCSPIYCAKKSAAPTFIIHGSADALVPLHQSQMLHDLMTECGAVCKLDVKKGMDHDPVEAQRYLGQLIDWFDKQLLGKKK